jgi:hypothetical protein
MISIDPNRQDDTTMALKGAVDQMNTGLNSGFEELFILGLINYIQAFPIEIQERIAEKLDITAEDLEENLVENELRGLLDLESVLVLLEVLGLELTEESTKNPVKYYTE